MKRGSKERGQIMILLALAIIVLLGFTALAVDMGTAYADRRQAQNAADAAALAGAQEAGARIKSGSGSCSGLNAADKQAAQAKAQASVSRFYPNGDARVSVDVSCDVSGQAQVTANLSHTVHGAVFQRDTTNAVQAMAGVKSGAFADGFALVALGKSDSCDYGVRGIGQGSVFVNDGSIFSNTCVQGNSHNVNIKAEPASTEVIYCHNKGCENDTDKAVVSPKPTQVDSYMDLTIEGVQDKCDQNKLPARGPDPDKNQHYSPGFYSYGISKIKGGDDVILEAGLYCINGNLDIAGNSNLTSNGGVTLYFMSGGLNVVGSKNNDPKLTLVAPSEEEVRSGSNPYPGIPGLLIYYAPGNTSGFSFHGGSGTVFTGTVYAPESSMTLGGGVGVDGQGIMAQFIGKEIVLNGNAELDIEYNGSKYYKGAATLDLLR